MWPWEHVAVAYLLYSVAVRRATGEPPRLADAGAVVVAAVLPDLVDKPLSWTLDLVPAGYSVAHSVFVAGPLLVVLVPLAHATGHGRAGVAVAVGYLSHLAGDVVYPVVLGDPLAPAVVLWPFVSHQPVPARYDLVDRVLYFLERQLHLMSEPGMAWLLVVELGLLAAVLGRWYADGAPGLPQSTPATDSGQPPE